MDTTPNGIPETVQDFGDRPRFRRPSTISGGGRSEATATPQVATTKMNLIKSFSELIYNLISIFDIIFFSNF